MRDFSQWLTEDKHDEKSKNEIAKEQARRERLRKLGNRGYTGTFDMSLVNEINGMDVERAREIVRSALEDYIESHPKMKRANIDSQLRAIEESPTTASLQQHIANFILSAGGLKVM